MTLYYRISFDVAKSQLHKSDNRISFFGYTGMNLNFYMGVVTNFTWLLKHIGNFWLEVLREPVLHVKYTVCDMYVQFDDITHVCTCHTSTIIQCMCGNRCIHTVLPYNTTCVWNTTRTTTHAAGCHTLPSQPLPCGSPHTPHTSTHIHHEHNTKQQHWTTITHT